VSERDSPFVPASEATVQKKEAITHAMEEYIAANPEHRGFTFFLPCTQDIHAIKQAAASISLKLGKPIDIVYPYEGDSEHQG